MAPFSFSSSFSSSSCVRVCFSCFFFLVLCCWMTKLSAFELNFDKENQGESIRLLSDRKTEFSAEYYDNLLLIICFGFVVIPAIPAKFSHCHFGPQLIISFSIENLIKTSLFYCCAELSLWITVKSTEFHSILACSLKNPKNFFSLSKEQENKRDA